MKAEFIKSVLSIQEVDSKQKATEMLLHLDKIYTIDNFLTYDEYKMLYEHVNNKVSYIVYK